MFKKIALTTLVVTSLFIATPHKAKAYIPVAEIIIGVQLASALIVAAEPLIKIGFKAFKKGAQKFITYVRNKRAHRQYEDLELVESPYKGYALRLRKYEGDDLMFAAPAA